MTDPTPQLVYQAPHGGKLKELADNDKLPAGDKQRLLRDVVPRYEAWLKAMDAVKSSGEQRVRDLSGLANGYKRFLELDFIWDSPSDFLFRQRGQLKLDGSVIEEFLPRLADERIIPALKGHKYQAGPQTAFSGAGVRS